MGFLFTPSGALDDVSNISENVLFIPDDTFDFGADNSGLTKQRPKDLFVARRTFTGKSALLNDPSDISGIPAFEGFTYGSSATDVYAYYGAGDVSNVGGQIGFGRPTFEFSAFHSPVLSQLVAGETNQDIFYITSDLTDSFQRRIHFRRDGSINLAYKGPTAAIGGSLLNTRRIEHNQQATAPPNPAGGFNNLYFKTDNKLYAQDSTGSETEIGVAVSLAGSRGVVTDPLGDLTVSVATSTEVGQLLGVTSNIQTQLNSKVSTTVGATHLVDSNNLNDVGSSSTAATNLGLGTTDTPTFNNVSIGGPLTADRALYLDVLKKLATSAATSTELGHLSGVTSNIQTQLNGKVSTIIGASHLIDSNNLSDINSAALAATNLGLGTADTPTFNNVTIASAATGSRALTLDALKKLVISTTTAIELDRLSGVTSNVQTQLNAKIEQAVIAYQIVTSDVIATSASFLLAGQMGWDSIRYSGYTSPLLVFTVDASPNRDMDIQIFDRDAATILGSTTILQGTGRTTNALSFSLPVGDTVIEVLIDKDSAGGTNPVLESAVAEYIQ